jgi:hypothetical protein
MRGNQGVKSKERDRRLKNRKSKVVEKRSEKKRKWHSVMRWKMKRRHVSAPFLAHVALQVPQVRLRDCGYAAMLIAAIISISGTRGVPDNGAASELERGQKKIRPGEGRRKRAAARYASIQSRTCDGGRRGRTGDCKNSSLPRHGVNFTMTTFYGEKNLFSGISSSF